MPNFTYNFLAIYNDREMQNQPQRFQEHIIYLCLKEIWHNNYSPISSASRPNTAFVPFLQLCPPVH